MSMESDGLPTGYYEEPDSLISMGPNAHRGVLALGGLASVSLLFTSTLLSFITWRMITLKSHTASTISRNQSVILIYQLILADFIQSIGFLISLYWAAQRQIIGPSRTCFAQGWLIQLGDVASALFVLAMAVHTTHQVIFFKRPSYRVAIFCILGIWGLAILLTALAPITGGRYVFMRAGLWCWISSDHGTLRLSLHYVWIFIVEFGSMLVYATCFYYLFRVKRTIIEMTPGRSVRGMRKARTVMLAYAIIYTILSLPMAVGRMASMSNNQLSDEYYLCAGALFTCTGWVDTILYAFTRRALLFDEPILCESRPEADAGNDDPPGKDAGLRGQNSTDSIFAIHGFASMGGITRETSVKVEHSDVESSAGTPEGGAREYYATAEASHGLATAKSR
ncbi:G protein-coupled glucose receptor regulating Gpa2-domain-containing protein [Hypoxylon sp. NC1633]|nr:G protein-coupled glucose receptor regulating Gpa2-domain-containing protein [Hypoxylon sp. NC1633]